MSTYSVAEEFAEDLGGRFRTDGDFSGEEFREDVLAGLLREAISRQEVLVVNFDGVSGMPTSFLEEAFGGLIRLRIFEKADVLRLLQIEAPRSPKLWGYVAFAQEALKRASPPT